MWELGWMNSFWACVGVGHNVKTLLENVGVDSTRYWLQTQEASVHASIEL